MEEGVDFQKLLKTLYKVPCRKTITYLIDTKFEKKKTLVIQKLQLVKTVCLTVDKWNDMQLRTFCFS